jgi:hypothetical protein
LCWRADVDFAVADLWRCSWTSNSKGAAPLYERLFDLAVVRGVAVSDFLAVDQDALYDES